MICFLFFKEYENKLSLFLIITEIKLSKKQSFKIFIFLISLDQIKEINFSLKLVITFAFLIFFIRI